jgi:hypothetical protein
MPIGNIRTLSIKALAKDLVRLAMALSFTEEVGKTLQNPAEAEGEMRYLCAALASVGA